MKITSDEDKRTSIIALTVAGILFFVSVGLGYFDIYLAGLSNESNGMVAFVYGIIALVVGISSLAAIVTSIFLTAVVIVAKLFPTEK